MAELAYQIYGNYYEPPQPVPESAQVVQEDYNESSYSINESFQQLLERPITNSEEANERHAEISRHSQYLVENAKDIVKTIVDELHTNKQTYTPSQVGGMAGGSKYIVGEIFIKFPIDNLGLYGGDDIVAAKTAGHELKGLSALLSCNIPNLHFPLVCVINYKGHRALVFTLVPIRTNTLVYGSADGGASFKDDSYEIGAMFSTAATKLNLQPHRVQCTEIEIPVPVDLEGHLGADGRYYAVDFSRLMPAETPTVGVRGAFLFRLLRPEFVHQYAHALSSDAFSKLAPSEEDNDKVRNATTHLHQMKIPKLAQTLPALVENQIAGNAISEADLATLKTTLHKQGVNLRQLGLLLYHVKVTYGLSHIACKILALEIIARVAKVGLIGIMRKGKNADNLIGQCADFLDLLVLQEIMSIEFQKQIEKQFVTHLHSTTETNALVNQLLVHESFLLDQLHAYKILLLTRISTLTGIKFNATKLNELREHLEKKTKVKISADFISELEITSKHINIVPIAEVLRVEGKLAEAHSFLKDELKLRKKVVGEDSLQVAITLTNLAELYADMGTSKDLIAERCLNKAMEIYEAKRPDTLECALAKERLAIFYYRADKPEYAEALLHKVLETKRKLLGKHVEVANTLEYMAWTAHARQKYQKALERYEEALRIKADCTTRFDPLSIATTLNNIGQTFCAVQQWDNARVYYKKLYELLKKHRGANHSDCAIALDNLAKLYAQDPENYDEARKAYEEALKIKKASLGENHVYTAITQDHLAQLLVKQGQFSEAEELYKSALATLRTKLGNSHSAVGITLHNIAQLFNKLTQYTGAREAEQEALNIFTFACGAEHQYTVHAKQALDELNTKFGKLSDIGSDEPATLNHSSMNMPVSSDKIPDKEKKSKVVYSQLLRDAGVKEEDIDRSLLTTVLAVIQEVKITHTDRNRISKSDSFLVLPPAKPRAKEHTDDSYIKSKTAHKKEKAIRSQSSKELISRFRERQDKHLLMNEPLFEFPTRAKKQDPERIEKSSSPSFASPNPNPNRSLRRQISNISSKNLLPLWFSIDNNNDTPTTEKEARRRSESLGKNRSTSLTNRDPRNLVQTTLMETLPKPLPSSSSSSSTSSLPSPIKNIPAIHSLPSPPSTTMSLKELQQHKAASSSAQDFKTESLEFYEDLLANIKTPTAPKGLNAQATQNSVTVSWEENDLKDIVIFLGEAKRGADWIKVYEGMQETFTVLNLEPNTHYEFRVAAGNSYGVSAYEYIEATTTYDAAKKDDDIDYELPTKNYGSLLRASHDSESDISDIDELEAEIFGKSANETENLEVTTSEDDKDPFFEVFLTSEEYRRVVAAAHDQLHRRKIIAELGEPQTK